ncbi:MAG: alpha/beta fold hydrolase [Neisseriaceae bacterium]
MLGAATTIFIPGPVGALETWVEEPSALPERGVLVILHPSPLQGGSNRNKVVYALVKAGAQEGYRVFAPNLRGVGLSEGRHDKGKGEVDDVLAIIQYVREEFPGVPLSLGGFSFGGYLAILVTSHFKYFHRLILVGAAVGLYEKPVPVLAKGIRVLIVHGEKDEIVPLSNLLSWADPQNLAITVFPGTGHFFHRKLVLLRTTVAAFLA